MANPEIWANKLLESSDVRINGNNPWDIKIINQDLYNRVKAEGSLGLGESYMDGWWECKHLDQFFYKLLLAKIPNKIGLSLPVLFAVISAKLFNLQGRSRAFQVGEEHYDLDNKLFSAMLGKSMTYSCGYWKNTNDLDSAEFAKLDLICHKLNLKPGQRILDIGCGWGSFAKYAAENYKVSVVGITISKEQAEFAKKLCKGLKVKIRLHDYRELNVHSAGSGQEKFDHIVSIGMFEHVGAKNHKEYFKVAKRCLKDDGLFLLHTIGYLTSGDSSDPWLNKYIFPNGVLPSLKQIASASEKLFVIEDVHNFGADYDKTLMAWHKNFEKAWPKLKEKYDKRFHRMWNYYLLSCAGLFRARQTQLWQIVLSPNGVSGGYKSIR